MVSSWSVRTVFFGLKPFSQRHNSAKWTGYTFNAYAGTAYEAKFAGRSTYFCPHCQPFPGRRQEARGRRATSSWAALDAL